MLRHTLSRIAPGARRLSFLLALALAASVLSSTASATSFGLPGISLADLVDGTEDDFMSKNGMLTFSDFSAESSGIAPEKLKDYRLVPLGSGFRLYSPLVGFFGHDASLDLDYKVTAKEGFLVEAVHLTLKGGALFGRSLAEMDVMDTFGETLADLEVRSKKIFLGALTDRARLAEAAGEILVDETIQARAGLISAAMKVDHRFKTRVIPEPATALLMCIGLLGLAIAGNRRGERADQRQGPV